MKRNTVLSQVLTEIFCSDCLLLDLTSLCIVPQELVWCLSVDVVAIDNAGSLLDACCIALGAALKCVKLPHVALDEDGQIVVDSSKTSELVFYLLF